MSRNIGFVVLVGMAVGGATLARALPITVDPTANWSLEGALRPSFSPMDLGGRVNWTGFYVGVNVGGIWDAEPTANFVGVPIATAPNPTMGVLLNGQAAGESGGFLGGAQIGYDFQWPFGLVTGVEADFQGATLRSQATQAVGAVQDALYPSTTDAGSLTASKRLDYLGTVRLRVGYQIIPNVLTYATGGFAYGQTSFNSNAALARYNFVGSPIDGSAAVANYASNRVGYAFGGGVEFPLFANLTARIEYLYYNLGTGSAQTPFIQTVGNTPNSFGEHWALKTASQFSGSIARVGVNYRFNPDIPTLAMPVVAKY
jgi:outer membrane immunogenic protein